MPLESGTHLGPYVIAAPIGAGGMGEVYRALDTKLQREVAVKVLPESYAQDPGRLERFQREARAVAALSHPNILSIYDFGREGGLSFAVTELLDGESLHAKLRLGALAPRKAVEYARQIAHGLGAAHEKGIVHRDLKPENLFVTRDGRVKILDFGLAKAASPPFGSSSTSESGGEVTSAPTVERYTNPGTVLGTVGYMSPEQVRGLDVDHRSDIFSFGAILHEMLSGERAWKRDTAPETLTAILREDPDDLSSGDNRIEPALADLVRHCLEKSPDERFQSARDLAYALSSVGSSTGAVSSAAGRAVAYPVPRRRIRWGLLGGVAAGALLGALATSLLRTPRIHEPPTFEVLTYSGSDSQPSASPDGKTIAFTSTRDGTRRIWLKQRAGGAEVVLTAGPDSGPRFSPDGSAVLFVRAGAGGPAIYRVPLVGGEARKVVGPATSADWAPDGREIGFLRSDIRDGKVTFTVRRIAADGTNEREVARVADHFLNELRWSPDGRTLAALETPGSGNARPKIALFTLDGGTPQRLEVAETGYSLGFTWNGDSRLLVHVGGGSRAVRARTARVFLKDVRTGRTRVLLSGIDLGEMDVLGPGSLVLVTGGPRSNLREISLEAPRELGRWLTRGSSIDRQPVYAPDGKWVAFTSNRGGSNDIWEVSTETGAVRQLTDDPGEDFDPAFTADGRHVLFSSNRSGHFEVWIAERDGSGPRGVSSDGVDAENPVASPDGQWVVYASGNPEKRGIWKVRVDGSESTQLAHGALALPEISPDGRLVSFRMGDERGAVIRGVRLADGGYVPLEVFAGPRAANAGRHRWLQGGGAIVFRMANDKGNFGIAEQQVILGKDTSATRRVVAGFTPDSATESHGVSPDGTRLAVAELQDSTGLLLAEGVDGVVARAVAGPKQP